MDLLCDLLPYSVLMLIEFKVSNFRSIREEQTFSLVASNADKDLPACVIERELPGLSGVMRNMQLRRLRIVGK